jgi:1,4-alpha-glucan branching enzyme
MRSSDPAYDVHWLCKGVSVKTQNRPKRKPAKRLVLFQNLDRQAQSACIAGTFNDWHPNSIPMVNDGTGLWTRELSLLPGRYEYLLVVDGHWKPDPRCDEKVDDQFGGLNSVLIVQPRGKKRKETRRLIEDLR